MTFLKTATVAFAAMSMVIAPVAASAAAPRFGDLRTSTEMNDAMAQSEGTDFGTYIIAFFAILAVGTGLYFAIDGSEDTPTSP